jgi:hypothetical protein
VTFKPPAEGTPGVSATAVDVSVATVADLRALTPVTATGYWLSEVGKEGHWRVDLTDTTSADDGGTILVTANGARLKRVIQGSYYRPEWFGAKGDWADDATTASIGTGTDDTAAFQACATAIMAADASGMELRAAYLLTGTVYVTPSPDSNRAKPFAVKGITGNPMTYRGRGARIVRRTSGDCFRVNLDSSGNAVLAAGTQYFGFSLENVSFVGKSATGTPTTTVTGIVGVRAFRTRMTVRNVAGVRVDDVVYQPDADASANDNYCDQSTYDNVRIISSTRGGLRLRKNDGGRVAGFYYEGPFSTAVSGLELSFGTAVEVKNIVAYTDPTGAPDTGSAYSPAAGSALISLDHVNAVKITGVHSERQMAFECLIDNNGCANTKVENITTLYAGRTFVKHRGGSRYLRVEDWNCTEDRQASTYDVDISGSSTDLTWERVYLTNYTGGAVRSISVNGTQAVTDDSADGKFSAPYKVYGDSNQTLAHDGAYQLNPITANRNASLSAPVRPGQQVIAINRNRTSFAWNIVGSQPLRPDGNLMTAFPNMTTTITHVGRASSRCSLAGGGRLLDATRQFRQPPRTVGKTGRAVEVHGDDDAGSRRLQRCADRSDCPACAYERRVPCVP